VGSLFVTTNSSGFVSFQASYGVTIPAGEFITATATKVTGTLETSEFSACVEVRFPD
jgi:hypothetical protein